MENGFLLCKKVDLSSTQGALCAASVFFTLHFTYLGDVDLEKAFDRVPREVISWELKNG